MPSTPSPYSYAADCDVKRKKYTWDGKKNESFSELITFLSKLPCIRKYQLSNGNDLKSVG